VGLLEPTRRPPRVVDSVPHDLQTGPARHASRAGGGSDAGSVLRPACPAASTQADPNLSTTRSQPGSNSVSPAMTAKKRGTKMTILHIEHPIRDFDLWKKAFDSDPIGRERSGVRHHQVLR